MYVMTLIHAASYPFGSVYRPFSVNSLWNSRPVNPVLDDTATIPTNTYYPTINNGVYSTGVFIAKEGDSSMTVYGYPTNNGLLNVADIGTLKSVVITRWPNNTLPASGSDGHCEIYDPISNMIHSFYKLKMVNGTWCATLYDWAALDGQGWGTPAQFYIGARATGVPSSAGLIRAHEIDDGDTMYRHALTLSLAHNALSSNPTYVFPATAADSDAATTNSGSIPEGSLLMLPSSFNTSKLVTTPKLIKIVETLKTYGAYVTDRNVGTPFNIYVEIGSNFTLSQSFDAKIATELQSIRAALRPLKSCSGYLNGYDQPVTFTQNQNLLSMRGPWSLEYGGSLASFDTWKQAVVFSNRTTKTSQRNTNGTGYAKLLWAKIVPLTTYNVTAITTGGGQFRIYLNMACKNLTNIDSGPLNNGESFLFTWPSSACWGSVHAISGVNQESTVSVQMLKYEPPVAVSSIKQVTSSIVPSNSTSPSSSRNVNNAHSLTSCSSIVLMALCLVLAFIY